MRVAAAVMLSAVIAGCGFQLRGAQLADPSLSPMHIEAVRPGSPLLPPLRRALANAGVTLADAGVPPVTTLRILSEDASERVIALSPQGRPREVELSYRVEFELVGPDRVLVERRAVMLAREFAVDERDVLGKAHEAEVLRDALLRDIVAALVRYTVATTP